MHLLDRDTAVPDDDKVTISADWSINDLPNGGYLMAVLLRAMMNVSTKKRPAILTAGFPARSAPGEAHIHIEQIASSAQFERFEARLVQTGSEKVRAMGTFVREDIQCTFERYEAAAPEMPPPAQCAPIPRMPRFTLYDQMEVRLDPECAGWMNNRHTDRSEFKGWITFRDERPYDAISLMVVADAFPPPVYASQGLAAWVPTLEMSVNIRKQPKGRWLKCIFRTRFVTCGLLEEDGEIWDETGELIALSRQIGQYRPF